MKLAVLGRTHWLLAAAEAVWAAGHEIVLVATGAPSPEYKAGPDAMRALAERVGAPFWNERDLNDPAAIAEVGSLGAQLAISINWPGLLREGAIAAFPLGILNSHAGDLPRYRGNACPNWAILNDEPHIGVCIHAMHPQAVDAGPIYARAKLPLTDETYIADVYAWLDVAIPPLFVEAVNRAADTTFTPQDQALSPLRPLRAHPRRPEDGLIDWSASAETICRLVRASSRPFAGAFSQLDGARRVTIWRARPVPLDYDVLAVPGQIMGRGASGGVLVACGLGVIEVEQAQLDDGSPLPAANRHRLTPR